MIVKTTSLNKFFEKQIEEFEDNVLLIDGHNMVYRNVFIADFQVPGDPGFLYWKFLMIQSLLTSIRKFQPKKVILAFDSSYTWRKKIFDEYKAQRKAQRDKSTIDFKKFFIALDAFIEDIKKTFPNIYIIQVKEAEADDVIAVCVKELYKKNKITILSSDKDMRQLTKYKNVSIYDSIKKEYVKVMNPEQELQEKILYGDKQSDNIPPIKRGLGKKTAGKILRGNLLLEYFKKHGDTIKENWERNNTLINFDCIPKEITESIVNAINTYAIGKYDGKAAWNFMIANKIKKFIDELQFYKPFLEILS
jgi:5'-3' exonuclease